MDATAAFRQQPAAQAAAVRLGVVVHPSRAVDGPLRELRRWAARHGGALVQIPPPSLDRRRRDRLAAIHAGAAAARPVLAVACGSPGALTSVPSHRLVDALERFRGATRSHGACRRSR